MSQSTTGRKLVYYVAVSIDQFIAHEDETMDGFLTEGQHIPDYLNSLQQYDTVLMGRRTYEWGYQFGVEAGQPVPTYGHMMQYVFSSTMPDSTHEQLHIVRSNPKTLVQELKVQAGGMIYLCGGGQLAGYLLEHDLIDEVLLKVNPVMFGRGIPLFSHVERTVRMSLLNTKIYNNGVIFSHYSVNR
ncbi:MAG: dihydrofolate reductase family protein [Chloroflexota bacterium]